RSYFLFLRQEKKFSGSAMSIGKAAFQLFFRDHLGHADWKVFSELVVRLPLVLSRRLVPRLICLGGHESFWIAPQIDDGPNHCGLVLYRVENSVWKDPAQQSPIILIDDTVNARRYFETLNVSPGDRI